VGMDRKGDISKLSGEKQFWIIMICIGICFIFLVYATYLGFKCQIKEKKVRKILMNLTGGNYSDYIKRSLWCQSWCIMKNNDIVISSIENQDWP